MSDDLTQFASRFKLEAAAALVQIYRDEQAPANARAAAAQQILAHANGRPGIVRPVGVDDISSLDDDSCERLFRALMRRIEVRRPGFFKAMMRDVVDQMLDLQATPAALPQPNRFRRGPLAGAGREVPRWPPPPALKPACDAIRSDSSGISAVAGPLQAEAPTSALQPPLIASPAQSGSRAAHAEAIDCAINRSPNVVTMPGIRREAPFAESANRPPPYGLRFGTAETLEHTNDTTPSTGGIHPSVLRRSQLKDPWSGQ